MTEKYSMLTSSGQILLKMEKPLFISVFPNSDSRPTLFADCHAHLGFASFALSTRIPQNNSQMNSKLYDLPLRALRPMVIALVARLDSGSSLVEILNTR